MEAILFNAPPAKEKKFDLCMYMDSNHADNKWTGWSRTSFMTYMNMSLIKCTKGQSPI